MATETTAGDYTICGVGDAPDAFGGTYPGEMRMLGRRLAAEPTCNSSRTLVR